MKPLLQWKSDNYYVFLCVCACARVDECLCMRVALLIQHATRMRHVVICFPSGFTTFFDFIS